ncbi:MAG: hypothetical protein ThorAB25_24930 [Candidatus Thorarchaeota archaeon AB_25]|nr:MAG: hypothetical protein ThorAB25_24930 [Candidatus Thorarchaeota archaeon AB_25]
MIKKTITLVFVLLMMSSVFMTPQTTNTSTLEFTPEQKSQVAETDLDRVTWEANVAPNANFEYWDNPKYPNNLAADRTTEEATWLETSIVIEGAKSLGMHARALDSQHNSYIQLGQSTQISWANPINLTLDLDWYLDEIGNPVNQDYVAMRIRMSNRNMNYYLGCTSTGTNGTTNGYFFIDEPTKVWNHLHRNLTSDYVSLFGFAPAQFETLYWYVQSYTTEDTRVFLDDVNLVNGSYVEIGGATKNGDFEIPSGSGLWSFQSNTDAADILQSTVSHEGSSSMNMTADSDGYSARANVRVRLEKRLSTINQGEFSFWWRIEDWINATPNSMSYIRINAANTTTSLNMYYYLCRGGSGTLPPVIFGDDMKFGADSFNVTSTWNLFEANIWEDYNTFSTTNEIWIENIEFVVVANDDESQLSILFDDMTFTASIMNDMGYETQASVGTTIQGWSEPNDDDKFTVTDFAYTGTKAANMTLEDDSDFSHSRELGNILIDETTELIFDFNVYIDTFNETAEDFIFFEFGFEGGNSISYIVANSSSEFESWLAEESNFIILQDTIVQDQWLNFQLDLVHDYESLIGSLPDTTLDHIYFVALASKSNKLTVFLDDLYIYYDPAPGISDVGTDPAQPIPIGNTTISATVVDATLETVVLNYRIDNGTWMIQTMNQFDGVQFEGNITQLPEGTFVEYYISATDAFGKSTDAMNGADYFSFTVASAWAPPSPLLPIVVVAVIAAIGVVILWYMFVFKKKE